LLKEADEFLDAEISEGEDGVTVSARQCYTSLQKHSPMTKKRADDQKQLEEELKATLTTCY